MKSQSFMLLLVLSIVGCLSQTMSSGLVSETGDDVKSTTSSSTSCSSGFFFNAYIGVVMSNQTIPERRFENNCTEIGGAMLATLSANVINNSTLTEKSAVCFMNDSFYFGSVLYSGNGFLGARRTMSQKRAQVSVIKSRISNQIGLVMVVGRFIDFTLSRGFSSSGHFMNGGVSVCASPSESDLTVTTCEFPYHFFHTVILNMITSVVLTYMEIFQDHHNALIDRGGVLVVYDYATVINQSTFWNSVDIGVLMAFDSTNMSTTNSNFSTNLVHVLATGQITIVTIKSSLFHHNAGTVSGVVFEMEQYTILVNDCNFLNNSDSIATDTGSGAYVNHCKFICQYKRSDDFSRSRAYKKDGTKVGLTLYGGSLERRRIAYASVYCVYGVTFIVDISDKHKISYEPVQMCFCNSDMQPDCRSNNQFVSIMKREIFTVPFWSRLGDPRGVMFMVDAKLTIDRSRFYHMHNIDTGILTAIHGLKSTVTVWEGEFYYNAVNLDGGAFLLYNLSHVTISRSKFTGNQARVGAALYLYQSTLTVLKLHFRENQEAECAGGAPCLNADMKSIQFMKNTGLNGGAVYAIETQLNMCDQVMCQIMCNSATDTGGDAYIYRSKLIC